MASGQNPDRRERERLERALQQEGEAVVALADAASRDGSGPTDFPLSWRNDFFKAQSGTFVPFVVGIGPLEPRTAAALLYVRVAPHTEDAGRPVQRRSPAGTLEGSGFPFEEIYPIELTAGGIRPTTFVRGFSVAPGDYDLTVVVRERDREADRGRRRLAAVLRRRLSVPDYSRPELSTSTVILADRLTVVAEPLEPAEQFVRPYVIAGREIVPAGDSVFRRQEELIVVFLVYNPSVTQDKHFDLEVEYHFFRKSRDEAGLPPTTRTGRPIPAIQPGEIYVNRTEPQRFNPAVLGPQFEPATGQPVMAGQGVPLAGFREGEYRLAIRVTDLVSGRSIERYVTFSVQP